MPLSLVSPLLAEQTMTTRFVLIYVLYILYYEFKYNNHIGNCIQYSYGIIVSAISFKNLPTLVPPYFWTIQGKLSGFDFNGSCIISSLYSQLMDRLRK